MRNRNYYLQIIQKEVLDTTLGELAMFISNEDICKRFHVQYYGYGRFA